VPRAIVRREKSNYIIQSVSHSLDVLEQFSGEAEELGVTELSKRLKLHKNNVFRLLATLESRGYIEQNRATENYRLGIRCLQLGQSYVQHMGLLRQARPIMAELVRQVRETTYLAVLRRAAIVPVEVVEADRPVRIVSQLGEALPLHCTAAGKAYLAFEPEDDLRALLPDGLPRFTERTIVDRAALVQQLRTIASNGYAVDTGEHLEDIRAVAAPVRDYARNVVATLAIAAPASRLTPERIEKEVAPLVVKAGRELSSRLGFDLGRREAQG
jgi:IclR family KDG regulon transcriptional repressor